MNTYKIYSFGCKTNQSDALSCGGMLQRAGWVESVASEQVDLLVVQSCTVTMSADAQARQLVRKLKRENPQSKILVTGCYAQRAEAQLASMPEIDYVIGNLNPKKPELISQIIGSSEAVEHPDFVLPAESPRSRPYIKIQDGCDARCSYCIIPSVRGRSRSLPPEEVIRRVESYRDRGYKEMILTGISMGGYGKDLSPKTSLSLLMRELDALRGDFRIRLSSVEPEEVKDDFIDLFTSSSRFQPHLHLPLQSASDRVLKRMRRQYLFHHFDRMVNRLFKRNPELNLGTDILVGFPDEDHDSYLRTRDYLIQSPIAYCHVFPFSPRPNTPAASYSASASNEEVRRRSEELRLLGAEKNLNYRRKFLGRKLSALVLAGGCEALTGNYIRVQLNESSPHGELVSVKIETIVGQSTSGSIDPSNPKTGPKSVRDDLRIQAVN
jgi:threonylcarbamoyladenosine tRNA methylthiotransferase MtaB